MSGGRTGRSGFSLIEVIIALVIFAIGLLGAVAMSFTASSTFNEARAHAWASSIAGEIADSLAHAGAQGSGERVLSAGRVRWTVEGTDSGSAGPVRVRIAVEGLKGLGRPSSAPYGVTAIVPIRRPPDPVEPE